MNSLVQVENLYKDYDNGLVHALRGVNLELELGKIYALKGASGCGKSTLLNIIGTLDKPSRGQVLYQGRSLSEIKPLHRFRSDFMGFVFQFHHLIPVLTIQENIEAALIHSNALSSKERREKALQLLAEMDIAHRAKFYANKISGGERQRAAIARAMANEPNLVLADEPTGNVDSKTARMILERLQLYVHRKGATLLIATHDELVATIADRVIEMADGELRIDQGFEIRDSAITG